MDENKKYLFIAGIIITLILSLTFFNNWLTKEINQGENKPNLSVKNTQSDKGPNEFKSFKKPTIDPLNDPLAPMRNELNTELQDRQNTATSDPNPKKTYELPQSSSPIIAQ